MVRTLLEISMPFSLDRSALAHTAAACVAVLRARLVVAAGYYFGYWFSHGRA